MIQLAPFIQELTFINYIILTFRLFVPFTILKWPLAGAVLSIVGDGSDVITFEYFGFGALGGVRYHPFDKFFDIWYLFFEFLIVLRWKNKLAKKIGAFLFMWRFIGFALFELTGLRYMFFIFPNIFEFFYLAWTIILKKNPEYKLTYKRLAIILLIVGVPNIVKEYFMHYLQFQTWAFFRDWLFWWLYN